MPWNYGSYRPVGELEAAHLVGSEERDRGVVLACFAIVVTHLLDAPMIDLFFFSTALDQIINRPIEFLDKVDKQSRRQPRPFLYVAVYWLLR
jgi:hypothetical protein